MGEIPIRVPVSFFMSVSPTRWLSDLRVFVLFDVFMSETRQEWRRWQQRDVLRGSGRALPGVPC